MTTDEPIKLELEILAENATDSDLYQMATNLYQAVRDSNVEDVQHLRTGSAPKGAKIGEVVAIGSLAVEVLPKVLPDLFGLIKDWSARGRNRTVKFKGRGIDFEGTPDDLEKLLKIIDKRKKRK